MNILLTGSGGFIGLNLKEYLKTKYTLFCPRSYELDLTHSDAVKKYFQNHKTYCLYTAIHILSKITAILIPFSHPQMLLAVLILWRYYLHF